MRRASFAVATLVICACGPTTVDLTPSGDAVPPPAHYRWNLTTSSTIETPENITTTGQQIIADVLVTMARTSGVETVQVKLSGIRVREGDAAASGFEPVVIFYTVGPDGRVTQTSSRNLPGSAGSAAGPSSGLLGSSQLPEHPLRLKDRWPAPLTLKSEQGTLTLEGTSVLEGFSLEERSRLARVTTRRHGPISTAQQIGNATAKLSGTLDQTERIVVDIDDGRVVRSDVRSTAQMEVSLSGATHGIVTVTQRSRLAQSR